MPQQTESTQYNSGNRDNNTTIFENYITWFHVMVYLTPIYLTLMGLVLGVGWVIVSSMYSSLSEKVDSKDRAMSERVDSRDAAINEKLENYFSNISKRVDSNSSLLSYGNESFMNARISLAEVKTQLTNMEKDIVGIKQYLQKSSRIDDR